MKEQIHDCYYEIYGIAPNLVTIIVLAKQMPEEILELGEKWGWNDTEVANKILKWMKE